MSVRYVQVQIRRLPKPVVCMVAGYAVGGGHILHMVCDLTIAADNAVFGQTGPKARMISSHANSFCDEIMCTEFFGGCLLILSLFLFTNVTKSWDKYSLGVTFSLCRPTRGTDCDLPCVPMNLYFQVGSFDAGYGSTVMSRLIGPKRAKEMWFMCRLYDAKQAMQMGLVNTVVPLKDLEMETVIWWVRAP